MITYMLIQMGRQSFTTNFASQRFESLLGFIEAASAINVIFFFRRAYASSQSILINNIKLTGIRVSNRAIF